LTADSTLLEWMSDPKGAEVLGQAFAEAMAGGDGVPNVTADPQLFMFLGSLPLRRLAAFPGSPLRPDAVEKLVHAANA